MPAAPPNQLAILEQQAAQAAAAGSCPPSSVQNAVKWTIDQVAYQVIAAGFKGKGAAQMTAVIMAESGGRPLACGNDGTSIDMGLVQLNSAAHPHALTSAWNPQLALTQAYATSNGGTDFGAWCSAWADPKNNCGHQLGDIQQGGAAYQYLKAATAAVGSGGIPAPSVPSLPNPLAGVAGAITTAANNAAKEFQNLSLIAVGTVLMLAGVLVLLLAFRHVAPGAAGAIKALNPATALGSL